MRETCEIVNDMIFDCGLTPEICAQMCRIFNGNWNSGGLLYAIGPSWQNMTKVERKLTKINGENTIELDLKNLHPVMIYSDVGATSPEYC